MRPDVFSPFLRRAALALLLVMGTSLANAAEPEWRTGAARLGEPKYKSDFKHFDYVNPDAPKGGLLKGAVNGTYDNLNPFIVATKGNLGAGIGNVVESLLTSSLDEPFTKYGLLADRFKFPDDYSYVVFHINPAARWHDGTPVTAEDVVWSFETTIRLDPSRQAYYAHVTGAKVTGDNEVTFTFDQAGNGELPLIVGELLIYPKHWWTANGPDGKPRNVEETTLEPPLGSGPYKVKALTPGRDISFERVKDYWGEKIPTQLGTGNFDEIRYDYYRDPNALFEAFKAGQYDFRAENSARSWATRYDFPAVKDGRVILETFDVRASGGMQSFTPNLRRDLFKDKRVREAIDLAFDFEELNRTITFGQYSRTESFFAPMELGATGLPSAKELEILEPLRDKVPPEVFTQEYKAPVNGDPAKVRDNLRKALDLLKAAGYELSGGKLVDAKTKKPFAFEILMNTPTFEPHVLILTTALKRLGIDAKPVMVDDTQYVERLRKFDFDMVIDTIGQSISPGNEQKDFFASVSADIPGSGNVAGIKDPAVDAIIPKIIFARDREELIAACRALDRVLLWNHYVIPQWHYGKQRLARWDRFSHPDTLPKYGASGFPDLWWFDPAKSAKTGARP